MLKPVNIYMDDEKALSIVQRHYDHRALDILCVPSTTFIRWLHPILSVWSSSCPLQNLPKQLYDVRILKLHETQSSELHTGTETTLASNCSRNNPKLKTGRKGKRNKGNGLAATEEFRVIIVKL